MHLEEGREVARTSGRSVLAITDMLDADERAEYKDLRVVHKRLREGSRKRG